MYITAGPALLGGRRQKHETSRLPKHRSHSALSMAAMACWPIDFVINLDQGSRPICLQSACRRCWRGVQTDDAEVLMDKELVQHGSTLLFFFFLVQHGHWMVMALTRRGEGAVFSRHNVLALEGSNSKWRRLEAEGTNHNQTAAKPA